MEKMIRVLKIEPERAPYEKEIPNSLKGSQTEVEGDIDMLTLSDGCVAVVNDEFLLNGMQPNRWCEDRIICGPFFICGVDDEGDCISLTKEQIEGYTKEYAEIPTFTGNEPELEPRMTVISF